MNFESFIKMIFIFYFEIISEKHRYIWPQRNIFSISRNGGQWREWRGVEVGGGSGATWGATDERSTRPDPAWSRCGGHQTPNTIPSQTVQYKDLSPQVFRENIST